jgi:hypothetical protein
MIKSGMTISTASLSSYKERFFMYMILITNSMRDTTARPPQGLEQSLNYKMLGLIVGLGVSFQLSLFFGLAVPITDRFDTTLLIELVTPVIPSIFAFLVARRYWGSEVFGKAYFALGLAYLMLFIGEIVWHYYLVVLQEEPYPSIADIFFFAFFPFAIYHLMKNSLYFKRRLDISTKIWLTMIPIVIVSVYSYLTFEINNEFTFDFYYGLIFVAATSVTLSFAILGARVFRYSILRTVWLLLVLGIIINSVADVWYYYLEIFGQYDEIHVVNSMWTVGYMIVAYALYKHRKTI